MHNFQKYSKKKKENCAVVSKFKLLNSTMENTEHTEKVYG